MGNECSGKKRGWQRGGKRVDGVTDLALDLPDWDWTGWVDIMLLTLLIWCFLWLYLVEVERFT